MIWAFREEENLSKAFCHVASSLEQRHIRVPWFGAPLCKWAQWVCGGVEENRCVASSKAQKEDLVHMVTKRFTIFGQRDSSKRISKRGHYGSAVGLRRFASVFNNSFFCLLIGMRWVMLMRRRLVCEDCCFSFDAWK